MFSVQKMPAHVWLGGVVFVSFFLNIWGFPLFDLDEGAFSEATREMFVRGDFMSTFLNGEPRHDKPILIYWLQVLSVWLFGLNEFGLRLPSALASSAWVAMVYYFVQRIATAENALWAAVVTATCVEVSIVGKAATADALLNLCVTSSMLFYFLHYRFHQRSHLYLFFICMGLGFLTKGPIAFFIPAVVTFLHALLCRRLGWWIKTVLNPAGVLLCLVVALPWYVAQYFKDGGEFLQGFFFTHNVGRFNNAMESHSGGVFYYVPVVVLGVLPYTALLFVVLRKLPQLIKDELSLYLLLWFAVVFALFSFSGTKLPHYVVYGFSALAILMALQMEQVKRYWLVLLPGVLMFALLLALPWLLGQGWIESRDAYVSAMLQDYRSGWPALYSWWAAAALLISIGLMLQRAVGLPQALMAQGAMLAGVMSVCVLPALASLQQQPIVEAAAISRAQQLEVVQWRLKMPSFNVYSESTSPQRPPVVGDVVLTKAKYLSELGHYDELYRSKGIALVRWLD